MDKPPYLTLVDVVDVDEFIPLPHYGFDERPSTMPLDYDECATAFALGHSPDRAARLLKVPLVRLLRFLRQSPRLQALVAELNQVILAKSESVPIDTLFDPNADARRLEWASTQVLKSRLGQGSLFAPAPPAPSVTLTDTSEARRIVFRWRTDQDDILPDGDDAA